MAFAAGAAKAPTHSVEERVDFHNAPDHSNRQSWRDMFKPRRSSKKPDEFYAMSEKKSTRSSAEDVTQLEHIDTTMTSVEARGISGGTALYDAQGNIVRQPAPTRDPKDPMNMTLRHKVLACFCLCFFGALAAAAELILGAMLPVFALEYAGLDPKLLLPISEIPGFLKAGSDPLKTLEAFGGPPLWKVYLLSSLPVLVIGLSNLALVPLAISCGRRSVTIGTGILAIVGCCWAGASQSLNSHLAARAIQAIGAGTVESLIPFIIQDMVYIHQRNTWIAGVFAAQGVIIIAIGFASPYIIIYLSWRWVYFMTAAGAGVFLVGVVAFMPETRWARTRSEMEGIPRDDAHAEYTPRTWRYNVALTQGKMEWRKGWNAFYDTMRTFFYPQIFFVTMLNSAMIAAALAATYTVAPNLLVEPWSWPFLHLGFLLVPILIAAIFVALVTGSVADRIANMVAKRRGRRLPENQLINLVLPTACALGGCVLFGVTGQNPDKYHWALFLFSLGLLGFGFLGANTVGAVYVLETYPHLAGPALVNIASFRCLIAFVLSFQVSEWIAHFGYAKTMYIYTGIMALFAALIPVVYIYGPAWKRRWPADHFGEGRVGS